MSLISLIEIIRSDAGTVTLESVTGKITRVENTHAANPATVQCRKDAAVVRTVTVVTGTYMDFWYDGSEWKILADIDINYDTLPLSTRTDDPSQVAGKDIIYFKNDAPFYRKGDGTVVEMAVGGAGLPEDFITANTSTGYTIDISENVYFDITLTDNCAFTFPASVESGKLKQFWIYLKQDGTGGRIVTWPASVKWQMDILPALDTTASTITILHFSSLGSSARWYGEVLGMGYAI